MTEEQEAQIREEFNRRALKGPRLEYRHPAIIETVFARMRVGRAERSLDIGCGAGWATRRLAQLAPEGLALGLDVSDEMIRLARRLSVEMENVMFVEASADEIPWQEDFFTRVLTVDSAFFWPDPEAAAREIRRVMAPGGRLYILNSYYRELPMHKRWQPLYPVPVHLKGEAEWAELFVAAGFESASHQRITDHTPVEADFQPTEFYATPEDKLEFRRFGALLVEAAKPAAAARPAGEQTVFRVVR